MACVMLCQVSQFTTDVCFNIYHHVLYVLQYTNLEPETVTQPLLVLCFQLNVTCADMGLPDVSSSSVDLSDELYSSDSVKTLPSSYKCRNLLITYGYQ